MTLQQRNLNREEILFRNVEEKGKNHRARRMKGVMKSQSKKMNREHKEKDSDTLLRKRRVFDGKLPTQNNMMLLWTRWRLAPLISLSIYVYPLFFHTEKVFNISDFLVFLFVVNLSNERDFFGFDPPKKKEIFNPVAQEKESSFLFSAYTVQKLHISKSFSPIPISIVRSFVPLNLSSKGAKYI